MAGALAAAHRAGIVHRDLKPANVMVTRDGLLKVVDFGLSKLMDRNAGRPDATTVDGLLKTEPGVVAGTAGYMSPEQASGDPIDARSDVFSFGVLLYEMLAGARPFTGDSYWSTMRAVVHQEPAPLSRVRADVPPALARLVHRCLEKDPSRRFASGAELQSALAPLIAVPSGGSPQRRGRVAAIAALVLALLSAVPLYRSYTARVRAAAIQELERDLDRGRYATAYVRARDLERRAPEDPEIQRALRKVSQSARVNTEPEGARVYFKEFGEPDAPWHLLGVSPIEHERLPVGSLHWRLEKDGYETVEGQFWLFSQRRVRLHQRGTRPPGMVYVPGGSTVTPNGPTSPVGEYWMDTYEVTNADYQAFVDAGGYQDKRWWTHHIVRNGTTVPWTEAMRLFVDRTGRPGPAVWEAGVYPAGRGDYPVTGVSWYEAAAFAEFSSKSLPTIHEWQVAGGQTNVRQDIRLANFGSGPLPVRALRDLGAYGTFGLAGNAKEWVWNGTDGLRYIMGGSWNEPPYMATAADARESLDRAATHGFRLVKRITPPDPSTLADFRALAAHFPPRAPVSDEVFEAFTRFYIYERTPLDAVVEGSSENEDWRHERISIAAAYGSERIPIQLLLPRNAPPPYQSVIWCPGTYSLQLGPDDRMTLSYYFDFVAKSGRAVVLPDFQGMYARRRPTPGTPRAPEAEAFRERIIQSAKDLNRTMDYLETRRDIDAKRVAFYAFSVGGAMLALPAMEPRLRSVVFLSGGLPRRAFPPEIEPVNMAPRLRIPFLLLGGRYDYLTPVEDAQKRLFERIGTPADLKRHVIFESGHVPERTAVIREMLAWLDRTLGPVTRS